MIESEDIPPVDESDAYKQSVREILSRGASDQRAKFLEAARDVEADDDEARFDERLRKVASKTHKGGDEDRPPHPKDS